MIHERALEVPLAAAARGAHGSGRPLRGFVGGSALGIHYRGVQWEGGGVDGGSIM